MKNHFSILASTIICLGLLPAYSQSGPRGGAPGGPQLGGAMSKLFGDNQAFSAGLEMQGTDKSGKPITMPGKLSFDAGKQRFEVNLADMKGGQMPPDAAAQMKSMGMDQIVTIARPDKKAAYLIYPGMQSYAEIQRSNADSAPTNGDYRWKPPKSARRPWTAIRALKTSTRSPTTKASSMNPPSGTRRT
jgi:hypothetical protein